jgi:hypothetical protein
MTDEYREAPPPTRGEFIALEDRMTALERRKPREPFVLRLWHTFAVGVAGTATAIYAFGWMYDNMQATGTRMSLDITAALFGVIFLITGIVSLAGLEHRDGLRSPWHRK